jgi:hypothetical protein
MTELEQAEALKQFARDIIMPPPWRREGREPQRSGMVPREGHSLLGPRGGAAHQLTQSRGDAESSQLA